MSEREEPLTAMRERQCVECGDTVLVYDDEDYLCPNHSGDGWVRRVRDAPSRRPERMSDEPRFCDHEEIYSVEGQLLVTRCHRCPSTAVADPRLRQDWRHLDPYLLNDPTDEEATAWSERVRDWPTIVVEDRYGGVYSGGAWLAFQPDDWPGMASDAFGSDPECANWWAEHADDAIGRDDTPDLAVADLENRLVLRAHRDGRP